MTALRAGDVVVLDRRASVQFGGDRGVLLRVISVDDRPTYDGWVWITGYALDAAGEATVRREVFVKIAGLRLGQVPGARKTDQGKGRRGV